MKVILGPGCDLEWWQGLNPWARGALAAAYRQGKHLPDRTNHGNDYRWAQAGCKTRDSYGSWRRTGPTDRRAHQRVVVTRREWNGFDITGIRRAEVFTIDPDTGVMTQLDGWVPVWTWHVGDGITANYITNGLPGGGRQS